MKILCIGDIMGKPGRLAMHTLLRPLIDRESVDITIANCENACGGLGITPEVAEDLLGLEVAVLTSGNHIWQKKEIYGYLETSNRVLRPENFPNAPGRGHTVVESPNGTRVGVINLQGRVYMPQLVDDPFPVADRLVDAMAADGIKVIVVDFHAETTSEKVAISRHLDGRASVVFGTHTHVQTSDEQVLQGGTARICDVGMTGPHDSVIGMKAANALKRFLTQRPAGFEVAKGDIRLEGVLVDVDEATGHARSIERVREYMPSQK